MKILVLVVLLATCVFARPDIGLELRQQQRTPLSSYGVPSASVTNSPIQISSSYLPAEPSPTFQTPVSLPPQPLPTYQTPVVSTPVPFYSGLQYVTPSYPNEVYLNGYPGLNAVLPQITSQGTSFIDQSSQPIYPVSAQSAEVQKHVYFFEAPEEPEEYTPYQIPVAPAKKNIKIIFIKAPTYRAPAYPAIPIQPQSEEKTLVYVLVKKPENPADIFIPTAPPTPPSKPEVYFIKYKTQKEAEDKVTNTLSEHANSGANVITNTLDSNHLASLDAGLSQNLITGGTSGITGVTDNTLFGGGVSYTTGPLLGGLGVTVSGNGLTGNYLSSTVPSTYVASTEPSIIGSSTGFESSTVAPLVSSTPAPISIGNIPIHPSYIPPVTSGPY